MSICDSDSQGKRKERKTLNLLKITFLPPPLLGDLWKNCNLNSGIISGAYYRTFLDELLKIKNNFDEIMPKFHKYISQLLVWPSPYERKDIFFVFLKVSYLSAVLCWKKMPKRKVKSPEVLYSNHQFSKVSSNKN